jgi:hypothetical protein
MNKYSRVVMSPAGVDPSRCAVHAPRKPGVAIHGHPFDACVSPLGPAGKSFCAFARNASAPASLRSSPDIHVRSFAAVRLTLRRTESRWFAGPWQTPLVACDEPMLCTPWAMTTRDHLVVPRDVSCFSRYDL